MKKIIHTYRKSKKKYFFLIELILVVSAIVLFLFFGIWKDAFDEQKISDDYVAVKEVALELQFSVYTLEEWKQFFSSYKENYVTREMVSAMLDQLGVSEVIPFEENRMKRAVTRTEWNAVYNEILNYLDIEHVVNCREILLLGVEWQGDRLLLSTNAGELYTSLPEGYFSDWSNYKLYVIGEECIGMEMETDTEAVLLNTYVCDVGENAISFLYQGKTYTKDANLGGQELAEGVVDLTVKQREIIRISQKQDYIIGNLLSYDDTTIEVEGYGKIVHQGDIPVYQVYDEVKECSISDIVIGNMEVKYIVGVNEVCAIILTAPAEISNVRVLLLADGNKFRENVYLMSDSNLLVTCGEETQTKSAGIVIEASSYIDGREETLILKPETADGYIYLCDANGKKLSNPYSGQMEVRKYESGYCVVNEVPFETYLYSVVPSEMPSNYQSEALKAQAVCARSYAYIQVMRADLAAYGAHINDSSAYQVYNNVAKTEAAIKAVDETAGKVMLYDGEVVEAYYFSTSMGYTDTVEVWNVLDATAYGYLKQACLNHVSFSGDLSTEEGFKTYLSTDVTGYDSDIRFYRWKIQCEDYAKLDEEILTLLKSRREAMKRHVTYYEEDGTEVEQTQNFGSLVSIDVAERSKAGSITKLRVNFEKGYVIVQNEYNIRKVLGTAAQKITYQNGSKAEWTSIIPSAFCTVERQEDGTYLLCGGGYGHGLGMSQNGANGLAKNGYTYEEILNFFYNDIELVNIQKKEW